MNLKERLDIIKNTNNISIKQDISIDNCFDIKNLFVDAVLVKDIVNSYIVKNKNILFLCNDLIDKNILAYSIKSFLQNSEVEIFDSVNENIVNLYSKIKILPYPSIIDVVKIFEYIIYGYKSFIFSLDISFDNNFLEKLKTVIAVNFKNLTEENINILIGYSELVVIQFVQNDNGLLEIAEVRELKYINGMLSLSVDKNSFSTIADTTIEDTDSKEENLYIEDLNEKKEIIESNETLVENIDIVPVEENDIDYVSTNIIESLNNKDENTVSIDKSNDIPLKKINKYKLLREKIKSKRNE